MCFIKSIDEFKNVDPQKYIDFINNNEKNMQHFISNGRINQVNLYCLLKSKYGNPNGIMTFLRGNHSNNIVEWDYILEKNNIILHILGSTRSLEFRIYGNGEEESFNEDDLITILKNEINKNRNLINTEKNKLEYWDIFTNTYKRLKNTIDEFYDKYQKIQIKEPIQINEKIVSKKELNIYMNQLKKMTEKVNEKKNYGLVLRMLLPVMGESLINMIIFLLLKDEIKNDKRLLENVFRSQIDIRIKSMYLNCNGLKKTYDQNDIRFKNYLRIMDKRNDFLHGNVFPAVNCFDNVYFDGTIPIFNEEKDIAIEFLKQKLFQVEEPNIEKEYSDIYSFKEYLLENMEDDIIIQIEMSLEKSDLGYNKKTKRIGFLFDDEMMQAYMIKK